MTRRDQHHSRGVTLVSLLLALAIILAALAVSGCGGSGGSGQGDKPVGDGTSVQKSAAQVTIHRADGTTTTIDFKKDRK